MLLSELASDLARRNDVTVICARAVSDRRRAWPLIERGECYGPVKVVRTFAPNISKRRRWLRTLDQLSYFALAAWAALRERADVVIAETDPPLLGLIGAALRLLSRGRFVYYCQDIYPEVALASGALKSRPLLWLLGRVNQFAYRFADRIIVLALDMAGLLRRAGVPADKIVVIPNWTNCRKLIPKPIAAGQAGKRPFLVMYSGNIGWTQNLDCVLEAAQLLRDDPRVRFALVGDGARRAWLQEHAKLMRLQNLEFLDRVATSKLSELLGAADLHLIPLAPGVAGSMVPSKVYGIMAAAKPFVAMMERHAEVARLASASEVGFVVPPGDAAALARTIGEVIGKPELLIEMGRRGRALAETVYDRAVVTGRFASMVAELCGEAVANEEEIATAPAPEIEKNAAIFAK